MTTTTPNGLPYPLGSDAPDGAEQMKQLALALDDFVRPRARRFMFATPADLANNATVELTSGFAAINGAGDAGNGKGLDYANGKITATRDMYVSAFAAANFVPNAAGGRMVELSWSLGYLRQIASGFTGATNVVSLAAPCIFLAAGDGLTVKLWQSSGAALSPGPVKFIVSELSK